MELNATLGGCALGCEDVFGNKNEATAHYESEHNGVVYIDTREKDDELIAEVTRVCEERNVGAIPKKLDSGDYVYYGEEMSVAIEYKEITDAVNSALNDRLFDQANRMAEDYDRAFIFIVGKTSEVKLQGRNIGYGQAYGQILGTIPQILATMNIPVQWLQNSEQFADVGIRTLIDSGDKGLEDNEMLLISPGVSSDSRLAMLMGIDKLGKTAAKKILEKFGGIEGLMEAEYNEIRSVDGIGSTMARKVWNTIHSEYESPGFDPKNKDHPMFEFHSTPGVGSHIMRDIWCETEGLTNDPYEYLDENYDIGPARTKKVKNAIDEVLEKIE